VRSTGTGCGQKIETGEFAVSHFGVEAFDRRWRFSNGHLVGTHSMAAGPGGHRPHKARWKGWRPHAHCGKWIVVESATVPRKRKASPGGERVAVIIGRWLDRWSGRFSSERHPDFHDFILCSAGVVQLPVGNISQFDFGGANVLVESYVPRKPGMVVVFTTTRIPDGQNGFRGSDMAKVFHTFRHPEAG